MNPSPEQLAFEKAEILHIPPRLLALALAILAENEQATEETILSAYRQAVLAELREEALAQINSSSPRERESAAYALSDARKPLVKIVRDQSPEYNRIEEFAAEDEPLKNYHLEAWNLITDELLMIKNKYRKVAGKTDLTEIVLQFCAEEVKSLQQEMA